MSLKAQKYLESLKKMNDRINRTIEQADALKASLLGSGIDYSKDHVQVSPEDRMSKIMSEYVDLNEYINASIDRYVDFKQRIIDQIGGLADPDQRDILLMIYVDFKSVNKVAARMGKSRRWVFHKKDKALNIFESQYLVKNNVQGTTS